VDGGRLVHPLLPVLMSAILLFLSTKISETPRPSDNRTCGVCGPCDWGGCPPLLVCCVVQGTVSQNIPGCTGLDSSSRQKGGSASRTWSCDKQ
jgi:hypothetical protein